MRLAVACLTSAFASCLHPMTNKTDAEMYQVLLGNDPVTNKPLMPEILSALTTPLTADEKKTGTVSPDIGPPMYSGTAG